MTIVYVYLCVHAGLGVSLGRRIIISGTKSPSRCGNVALFFDYFPHFIRHVWPCPRMTFFDAFHRRPQPERRIAPFACRQHLLFTVLDDMAKPNLPVVIFLQVLVTQVIAWVGKSFLQDVAFDAYSKFVLGANAKKQRELRKQVLADKAELQKTSSQDEFAKWARLKRKVDKGLEQLEKESECYFLGKDGLKDGQLERRGKNAGITKRNCLKWISEQVLGASEQWKLERNPLFGVHDRQRGFQEGHSMVAASNQVLGSALNVILCGPYYQPHH